MFWDEVRCSRIELPSEAVRAAMNRVSNSERDDSMQFEKVAILTLSTIGLFGILLLTETVMTAQNQPTKDDLAAIGEAQLTNQANLSRYTWQETQFISVNGKAVD